MRGWLARGALLAGSFLAVMLLVEVSLRVAGFVLTERQRSENARTLAEGEELVILCVGESTTALGGDSAYPRLLEDALRARYPDMAIAVINGGRPRVSTDRILADLPGQLDTYRPHIVISMLGINDGVWFAAPAREGMLGWLESLRVVTLVRLGLEHLGLEGPGLSGPAGPDAGATPIWDPTRLEAPEMKAVAALVASGEIDEALERARDRLEAEPADLAWLAVVDALSPRAEGARALRAGLGERLTERLEADPGDMAARAALIFEAISRDDPSGAEALAASAPEPGLPLAARHALADRARLLAERRARERDFGAAAAQLEGALGLLGSAPGAEAASTRDQLAFVYDRMGRADAAASLREATAPRRSAAMLPRTRANYLALRELLAARGIEHVAVQYPLRPVGPLADALRGERDVVLVDRKSVV